MMSPRRKRNRALATALYVNAAVLLGILVVMLTRSGGVSFVPAAYGADAPGMGGGGNLYLIPGQFSERTYGCYIMDTDAQTVVAYKFDGASTKLNLIAARNFRHDRRLGNFNTSPDPKEVEVMVEAERAGSRRARPGQDDAADPDPAPAAPPAQGAKQRGNSD